MEVCAFERFSSLAFTTDYEDLEECLHFFPQKYQLYSTSIYYCQ